MTLALKSQTIRLKSWGLSYEREVFTAPKRVDSPGLRCGADSQGTGEEEMQHDNEGD